MMDTNELLESLCHKTLKNTEVRKENVAGGQYFYFLYAPFLIYIRVPTITTISTSNIPIYRTYYASLRANLFKMNFVDYIK